TSQDFMDQTTMTTTTATTMAPSPNTPKSSDSISFNANSRSKSCTKRKTNGTREDPQKTAMDEKVGEQPVVPNSKSPEDNKKKEKDFGLKSEEVPVKIVKKKVEPPKKEEQEASVFEVIYFVQNGVYGDTVVLIEDHQNFELHYLNSLDNFLISFTGIKIIELKVSGLGGYLTEEVEGPAAPAQSGTHGIKNKMRWKIDVEGADVNGDQKMSKVLEKMAQLRKNSKMKKCKAVDEKKAKVPMMALLMACKDLLYVSWSKPNHEVEYTLDGTWAGMTVKKGTGAAVQNSMELFHHSGKKIFSKKRAHWGPKVGQNARPSKFCKNFQLAAESRWLRIKLLNDERKKARVATS
ncbi:Protein CBG12800, partial [Caenorhabditis briggsae]